MQSFSIELCLTICLKIKLGKLKKKKYLGKNLHFDFNKIYMKFWPDSKIVDSICLKIAASNCEVDNERPVEEN